MAWSEMTTGNWIIVSLLIVLQLILLVAAVMDLVKGRQTNGPKWLWVMIVLVINTLGPILYFLFGRKKMY